jgi:hypothetical protein
MNAPDPVEIEPFPQYAGIATPEQLVDMLFAHCHPEAILGVWKLLRECFDPASADQGAACLFEPLAPRPPALRLNERQNLTDAQRWAAADAEDERNRWGDTRRRIQTAFAER